MELHSVDIWIILVYFVFIVGKGFYLTRLHAGTEDYFLAGRQLGWLAVGFSLFASNISSTTLIGLSGSAYATGISIYNYEWMAAVVLVLFAVFVLPFYLSTRIFTVPEFFERRFGPGCKYYFSGLTILGNIFIDTAGTLYAGSLVIRLFFPQVGLLTSTLALAALAGFYASAGGLRAVVYTDVVQAVVLLIGSCLLTWYALDAVGSWASVVEVTPPEKLSLIQPISDPTMPWLGTLIGVPILGFYFWCTNQFIVQRVLAARNLNHARWGSLFGGFLKLPVLFIMVFPGLIAVQLYPDLSRPDMVFPTMLSQLLPVGIRGVVLAGLLAAIMSSVDSTLNSASTLVTMDFVRPFFPEASDRRLAWAGRMSCVAFMLAAALWVPVISSFPTLFEYLQSALAYLFPPVVAVLLVGLFNRKVGKNAALVGLCGGHLVSLGTFLMEHFTEWFPKVHFLILAGVFLAVSAVLTLLASCFTQSASPEQVKNCNWSCESLRKIEKQLEPVSWFQDYRLYSVLLIAVTGVIVWIYR